MHNKKAILVKIILRRGSFFPLVQLKEGHSWKMKQKYEKEGQDIHIIRITTTFGCQQVDFLIFPDLIRQPAAIAKTKIELLNKNID